MASAIDLARTLSIGCPSASAIAGAATSANESRPNRCSASSAPSTMPGTSAGSVP